MMGVGHDGSIRPRRVESAAMGRVGHDGSSRSRPQESVTAFGAARNSKRLVRVHPSWPGPSVVPGSNGRGRLRLSCPAPTVVVGSVCRVRLRLSCPAPSVVSGSICRVRLDSSWSPNRTSTRWAVFQTLGFFGGTGWSCRSAVTAALIVPSACWGVHLSVEIHSEAHPAQTNNVRLSRTASVGCQSHFSLHGLVANGAVMAPSCHPPSARTIARTVAAAAR